MMCVSNFGLWREYAIVKPENVFPIPDRMSFEEAAAIPVNYLTAYMMLFDFGNLRKNQSVLVHMAAGKNLYDFEVVYNLVFFVYSRNFPCDFHILCNI